MAGKFDLYTILKTYALRTRSAKIPLEPFVRFLHASAVSESGGARLGDWAQDTAGKVKKELEELMNRQKADCYEEAGQRVVALPLFYAELVAAAYEEIEDSAEVPLPDDRALKIVIPPGETRNINVEIDLVGYLSAPQRSSLPVLKLVFKNANGVALALSAHLPLKLLEIAVAKLRDSLGRFGTLEFFGQKLINHFHRQEPHIKEFIQMLMSRPAECVETITKGGDFSFSAWMYLCQMVKNYVEEQVDRSNERKPAHIAIAQSASLILAISSYYKVVAMEQKEKDMAFSAIDQKLFEPPYLYTVKDIYDHKTSKGKTVLEQYGEKEVSDFIKRQLNVCREGELPGLLSFNAGNADFWLVKKEKVIPLCAKLMHESAGSVSAEIKDRWTKKLKEYRTDASMRSDEAFEELVEKTVAFFSPPLAVIARDKRTALAQEETGPYPSEDQLFSSYKAIPWRVLFRLRRDNMLTSCRIALPFWYSIPFIVKIIAFTKYGPRSLIETKKRAAPAKKAASQKQAAGTSNKEKLRSSAQNIARNFLPEGSAMETYMGILNDRWNQRLDKKEREHITKEVNAHIKNYMNSVLKIQSRSSITEETINDTVRNIIDLNQNLKNINDRNSLRLYIKAYILELLSDAKF